MKVKKKNDNNVQIHYCWAQEKTATRCVRTIIEKRLSEKKRIHLIIGDAAI